MKTFTFEVTLSGVGETEEEAWQDAVDSFAAEPGIPNSSSSTMERSDMEMLVVTQLIRLMKAHGWETQSVFDGGDSEYTKTEEDVLNIVFSVDESTIQFKKDGVVKVAYIILGNDGYDCIADHSLGGEFEQIMDEMQSFCDTLAEENA